MACAGCGRTGARSPAAERELEWARVRHPVGNPDAYKAAIRDRLAADRAPGAGLIDVTAQAIGEAHALHRARSQAAALALSGEPIEALYETLGSFPTSVHEAAIAAYTERAPHARVLRLVEGGSPS